MLVAKGVDERNVEKVKARMPPNVGHVRVIDGMDIKRMLIERGMSDEEADDMVSIFVTAKSRFGFRGWLLRRFIMLTVITVVIPYTCYSIYCSQEEGQTKKTKDKRLSLEEELRAARKS